MCALGRDRRPIALKLHRRCTCSYGSRKPKAYFLKTRHHSNTQSIACDLTVLLEHAPARTNTKSLSSESGGKGPIPHHIDNYQLLRPAACHLGACQLEALEMTRSIFRGAGTAVILLFQSSLVASSQEGMRDFEPSAAEFVNSCSSCHGDDGKGAGFLTRVFKGIDPGDLTQLAANNGGQFPFERVFEVIDGRAEVAAHGDRKMPVWGDRYWEDAMSDYGPDELNRRRARTRVLEVTYFLQSIQE